MIRRMCRAVRQACTVWLAAGGRGPSMPCTVIRCACRAVRCACTVVRQRQKRALHALHSD
eukprot:1149535-Pelagomonas_calceolata.AAC.6